MLNKFIRSINRKKWVVCRAVTLCALILFTITSRVKSQMAMATLFSKNVLYAERIKSDADLKRHIKNMGSGIPINDQTEYQYEAACNVISQYMLSDAAVHMGFQKLFNKYQLLSYDTKRAFLEAVYAVGKGVYTTQMVHVLRQEVHEKLFSMAAVYLLRSDTSNDNLKLITELVQARFLAFAKPPLIIKELLNYIDSKQNRVASTLPDLKALFAFQQTHRQKVVYSFQRWNRDYAGMALVQLEDGQFAKHPDGRLMVFEQLARSASDLPYFITNGNTPQGCYRVTGMAQSKIGLIGPTPNLQLIMPFEESWKNYLGDSAAVFGDTTEFFWEEAYWINFPLSWQSYKPMKEVFMAGQIGRSEIIAHGTTIDPEYYKESPFYPLTPTMGCLCAREQWNTTTGRIAFSEQYNLANTWSSSPSSRGLLYVINIDNQQKNISRKEIEAIVKTVGQ